MGCLTGIDPVLPLSQSRVQATTLKTPLIGTAVWNRTTIPGFVDQCIIHYTTAVKFGPAYRNRTHIRGVEDHCIIHYTNTGNLAGVIGFEPMITISKTVALGQTRRNPNRKNRIHFIAH